MTEKQEKIIEAALKLFACEGYQATSTAKVAKLAGVSEGLIFRHFGSKDGLLEAIIEHGKARANLFFADVLLQTEPEKVIEKAIELPFKLAKADPEYWKLLYILKWHTNYQSHHKLEPLILSVSNALKQLGYKNPETEAHWLAISLESLSVAILRDQLPDSEQYLAFLKQKYNLVCK